MTCLKRWIAFAKQALTSMRARTSASERSCCCAAAAAAAARASCWARPAAGPRRPLSTRNAFCTRRHARRLLQRPPAVQDDGTLQHMHYFQKAAVKPDMPLQCTLSHLGN